MKSLFLLLATTSVILFAAPAADQIEAQFLEPPRDAGPEVWWHWLNGNISREGITRDLAELRDKGFRGATVFSIGHSVHSWHPLGPVRFQSPEWHELFRHAVSEARRLGLKLVFHNCDGWATSGGPWVKPEDAMKELVFSETAARGPRRMSAPLPQPRTEAGYYRDIAAFAVPGPAATPGGWMRERGATFHASTDSGDLAALIDDNPTTFASLHRIMSRDEVSIEIRFAEPVEVSRLFLYHIGGWGESQADRCELFAMEAGGAWRSVREFRHRAPWPVVEFPATRADRFKVVFHTFDRFASYVVQQKVKIRELQLLPAGLKPAVPLLSDWDNKAGYSNFRVAGNYPPQGPVPPDQVFPRSRVIPLDAHLRDGTLEWDMPAGDWRIIRLGYTITGKPNEPSTDEGRGLECDKFSAESVDAFFRGFPQQVLSRNQGDLGGTLQAMLIDSWEAGHQNWTRNMPAEFARRRGYPIDPWLPVLAGRIVESTEASERFLWDFRRTMGDLIADHYFGRMRELCARHGILLQAEASHVALQYMVDGINYQRLADIPMNEFWIEPDGIGSRIRGGFSDATSAAHLYGKRIVATESFTCAEGNWRHTPAWLKPAADKVFAMGINRVTFDTYTHQPDERAPGWHLAPWGVSHNRKLTWWEYSKPWIRYLTRCQTLLQRGDHVADFLIFTGEGVPNFVPIATDEGKGPVPAGHAYDGCDRATLLGRLEVRDGKLFLPHGPSYHAVVLPAGTRMTPELAAGLARLVEAGAVVFGPRPSASPSLQGYPACDDQVRAAAALAWGEPGEAGQGGPGRGRGRAIEGVPPGEMAAVLNLSRDFAYTSSPAGARIEYLHKRDGALDFYFLSNQGGAAADALCTFRIGDRQPELWHPDDGRIEPSPAFRIRGGHIEVPIRLDPHGSAFVVFRRPLSEEERRTASARPEPAFSRETVLESFPTGSAWRVRFEAGLKQPRTLTLDKLSSWTAQADADIRHYSGTAVYTNTFLVPPGAPPAGSAVVLDLGSVREIARVLVNGVESGILWKPPYRAEITRLTRPGENRLEIQVVNTWTNRMIGDLALPEERRVTWTHSYLPLQPDSRLMESGLLGPVNIVLLKGVAR